MSGANSFFRLIAARQGGAHELEQAIRQLKDIGFLEEVKSSWKVPMLYRDGLEITQGKGFQSSSTDTDDAEDEEVLS